MSVQLDRNRSIQKKKLSIKEFKISRFDPNCDNFDLAVRKVDSETENNPENNEKKNQEEN